MAGTARRTALYRFFDSDDQLLYIGIAYDPNLRRYQHAGQPWRDAVARQVIEWYPSRQAAEDAERKAIEAELPLHNIQHHPVNGPAAIEQMKVSNRRVPNVEAAPQITLSDLYADRDLTNEQVRKIVSILRLREILAAP